MVTKEQKENFKRNATKFRQQALELFDKRNITVDPVFEEKLKTTKSTTDKVETMFKQVE